MDASTKQNLVKAIQLLKSGDKKSAVPLLANVLKQEPNLVQAWYLLGLAVDSEAQKIKAFNKALQIDPGHEKARQALAKLAPTPPAEEITSAPEPEPEPEREPEPEPETYQPIAEEPVPQVYEEPEPEPEPEPESETYQPIAEEPVPPANEEPAQMSDDFATEALDEGQVEFRGAFTEEPAPFEESAFTEQAPAEEETPEMDLRAEFDSEPVFQASEAPEAEAPFGEPPVGKEAPEEEQAAPADEFALPDWMSESSFDPSEYQTEETDADPNIYENTEADIPEWARMNPLVGDGAPLDQDAEADSELPPDMPAWASMIPPKDQRSVEEEPAQGEDDIPSWAVSDDMPPADDPYDAPTSDYDRVSAFFEEEDAAAEEIEEDRAEEEYLAADETDEAEEEAPEEPDWLRDMVDEEEGGKKKKKKRRKKELTPTEKKERRKRIIRLLLLVIIVGGTAAGYLFREELKPYWAQVKPYTDKVVDPVKTLAAPATDLLTQGAPLTYLLTPDYNVTPTATNTPPAQPTAEPTWTPQVTEEAGSSTLAPNETPTVTPTTAPLPNAIESQIEEIETQIEILRGKAGPTELIREFMTADKLQSEMEILLIDADRLSDFEDDQIVLKALGLARGDANLTENLLNNYADSIGGFYSPETEKVYVVGSQVDGFGSFEKYIYALEYAHVLQDNNFNLSNIGYYPKCTQAAQACQALNALVKGEAALVQQLWLGQNAPEDVQAIADLEQAPVLFGSNQSSFFAKDATFATTHGLAFVEYLFNNGGWNAVDRAFSVIPSTTEQIMHPEKYQQREEAGGMAYPSYIDLLGQQWELIREDSLGEWYTYLLLGYNDYPTAQRPDSEAAIAAAGWSVDRYQVFYNPEEQQTFLSAYWIWDTQEDGNQFYQSLDASMDARFGGTGEELPEGGKCWTFGGEKSCIQQKANKVYWLLSENSSMIDLVRERFSVFP